MLLAVGLNLDAAVYIAVRCKCRVASACHHYHVSSSNSLKYMHNYACMTNPVCGMLIVLSFILFFSSYYDVIARAAVYAYSEANVRNNESDLLCLTDTLNVYII